jgi:hypothetical protein
VRYWRFFLKWFNSRIAQICAPGLLAERESRLFLKEVNRQISIKFPRTHMVFSNTELLHRAVCNLSKAMDLSSRGHARLKQLGHAALRAALYGVCDPATTASWRRVDSLPAPPLPGRFSYLAPDFYRPEITPDAEMFAATLENLESEENISSLLQKLSRV